MQISTPNNLVQLQVKRSIDRFLGVVLILARLSMSVQLDSIITGYIVT